MIRDTLKTPYTIKELDELLSRSSVERLALSPQFAESYQLDIKRDDLIHPVISGNKWRKLKYLLRHIEESGLRRVAAMGGRYSNFLHALSYACHLLGWKCELFVRGYQEQPLTQTLVDCNKWGASINFVDRAKYKSLRSNQPKLPDNTYWVTEGGLQMESTLGVAEIADELSEPYDYLVIASATGTSVAGLVKGVNKSSQYFVAEQPEIIGISVLNNQQQQVADVKKLIGATKTPWQIKSGYEFGGFAKKSQILEDFSSWFESKYQIEIEPIYTGRSFYAVFDLMDKGYFDKGSRILLIHCGGLQGARSSEL